MSTQHAIECSQQARNEGEGKVALLHGQHLQSLDSQPGLVSLPLVIL